MDNPQGKLLDDLF